MRLFCWLLLTLFISDVADARPRGSAPGQHNGRRIQLNVADGTAGEQFLNFFKSAGRWNNVSAPGNFDVTRLDANGYPTSLPTGGVQVNINIPASAVFSEYVLLWDGGGTMGSSGSIVSGSYSTSGVVLSFGSHSGATIQIKVLAVNSSSDYPNNIRLVANNGRDVALLAAGQIWRPEYLNYVASAGTIRTMDLSATNTNTVAFWADRKPMSYYTYNFPYWPPGKIVPIANVSFDGVTKYSVTWGGQTGSLTDKTQFIAQVPTTQLSIPSTLNLNGTGDIQISQRDGQDQVANLTSARWMLFTYDESLSRWMVDDTGGSSGTGITTGAPPELMIALANTVGANLWLVPGAYQCDYGNNTITDYQPSLAALVRDTLFPTLKAEFEIGPNELWNANFLGTQYAWKKQQIRNGGRSAYAITGATAGTTTVLTIGTNTTQVGSLLTLASIGGLTPNSGNARVLSKPSSTQIEVNVTTTGTYTSGGTATPNAFDDHNWYGTVGRNTAQAYATAFGIGTKGTRYRPLVGFQSFGAVSALNAQTGSATRLTSPFWTARGEAPVSGLVSDIVTATYFGPGYFTSSTNMTIAEGKLAFEYPTASAPRKTAILDEYSNSTQLSTTPITITNITPGNPTVLTVDRTDLFLVSDGSEVTSMTGITGNIGTVLNRSTYNSPNFTILSKTGTTVTINANTTGLVYSGGGMMTSRGSLSFTQTNLYANIFPQFLTYVSTYSLGFKGYEGGQSTDRMINNASATIKGVTNGATTVVNVGANSWDYLYNTVGLSGMTTTIAGIAAGTLAIHLNGNTYTILSATATTITINVDTSADSAWVSGGTALYVGSQTAVTDIRDAVNFTPAAQVNTVANYNNWVALCGTCDFPSEFTMVGQANYSMFTPGILGQTSTPYRWQGMNSYNFLLKRDLDPASNDNDPMWLEKAA